MITPMIARCRLEQNFPAWARCILFLTGLFLTLPSPAAEAGKRVYDVPSGDARTTLKLFAEQSGQEIIYPAENVAGVKTNALQGEFTPREAIDRLVADTSLSATSAKSGAIAVNRKSDLGAQLPAQGKNVAPGGDSGLTTRFGASTNGDETIVLSPFVVTSSDDQGYRASNTLAGSRIKSPLRDIAAQVSVFTPELMEDLGLTNLEEVYLYSTNVEGYLEYTPGADQGTAFGSLLLDKNNRIRGLGPVTLLRSFFETSFDIDTYNTERVTIASGPNAILFGLGNPGGITDASLKQAGFRNRTALSYRRDNFHGRRFTFDTNQVLVPKKAALRVAALDANNRTFRTANNDVNRRLYGTLTLRPFANTTIRLNGEWIEREASRASMVPVHDYVTPWLDAGKPSFDNSGITSTSPATTLTNRINAAGLSSVLKRSGGNTMILTTGNTQGNQPVANWVNTVNVVGLHTLAPILQDRVYEWSLLRPEIYDPYGNVFGDGNLYRIRGRVLNGFVEQKITKDFYIEAGFMKEHYASAQGSWVDGNNSFDLNVDANRYLPDGATPNPNFGKLYTQTNPQGNRGYDDRQESRLTASYDLDFTRHKGWASWFGRHRLAAMYSYSDLTSVGQGSRLILAGAPSFLSAAAKANLADASRLVTMRTYLGNGVDHVSSPVPGGALDFNPTLHFTGPGGEQLEARMYDNPDGSYPVAAGTVRNVISRSLADQSYLLKDRLIVTYGWRESRVRMKTSLDTVSTTRQANGLFPNLKDTHFAPDYDYYDKGQSINWGLVGRPLPWLSIHYANSENFAVQENTWFDPFGNPFPGSNGTGKDYGFSINLADGKFNLRINRFVNDQKNIRPDNIVSALTSIPKNIETRILQVAPNTPKQGIDFDRYSSANYQVSNTSEATGYDIEMTINPTKNWRGVLNVGRQRTETQIDDTWWRWVEQRLPVWQTFGGGWDVEHYTAASPLTIHNIYDQWVATQRDPLQATNGRFVDNQREWRASGILTYLFTDGRLRGATAGLGGRWRSPNNLGYGLSTLSSGQQVLDLTKPYKGSSEFLVDAFATYSLRNLSFLRLKSNWKLQLNVRNLLDKQGLIPTHVLTDGTAKIFTYQTPRQIILTMNVEL